MASSPKEEINQKEIKDKVNPDEVKEEQDINTKKKLKSKFNLLDQGRLMIIGTNEEISKNLIIIGPKGSGKSSIFSLLTTGSPNNYSDNGTCGVNFGFMRSQSSSQKKVMNVFEIGSGIENIVLINTILNNENFEFTTLLIILDFDDPKSQLNYLIKCLSYLRKIFIKNIEANIIETSIKNRIGQYQSGIKPGEVDVFPLETFVIGNKYDILEKIEEDKLKWICLSLRYQCVINGMNLIFYSSNNDRYKNILQSTTSYYAFNQSQIDNIYKYSQKNELHALYTQFYNDSLEEIGEPRVVHSSGKSTNDRWIETYNALFMNVKKKNNN